MRVIVGSFEYARRDYTPRKGDPPRHDWIRDHAGHKAIVGMEVAVLVDEIVRLRESLEPSPLDRALPPQASAFEHPGAEPNTIVVLPGHPRYCPVETQHDSHEFRYAYLDKDDGLCRGSYTCPGDPAPWSTP